MRTTKLILTSILFTGMAGATAVACEYHGGFAPPGYGWNDYNFEQTPMDDSAYATEDQNYTSVDKKIVAPKKKPVFSTAASRASSIAKARVERKSDEVKVPAQDAANKQASR